MLGASNLPEEIQLRTVTPWALAVQFQCGILLPFTEVLGSAQVAF